MTWKWVGLYLIVYALALAWLAAREAYNIAEPLVILAVAGGGFTALAWLLTRGTAPLGGVSVRAPMPALILYLIAIAVIVTWGFSLVTDRPWKIVLKLAIFVAAPVLIFRTRLPLRMNGRDATIVLVLLAVMTAFQLVVGSGGRKIAEAHLHGSALWLAALASFVWMSIEAGLTEEVTFRALVQTRLEAVTRSGAGGIVVTALLFGLIHAPGLYLRTSGTGESFTNPTLPFAIAYSIVVLSPMGLFFGVLWTRTRNILVLVLVHGAVDAIPHVAEIAKILPSS